MKFHRPVALAAVALAMLGGCHKGSKGGDQRTASGQVLEGSISDAMIPYESLKSKPPLAPRVAAKPSGGAANAASDAGNGAAAPEADAAAEPTPAASASGAIHY